MWIIALENHVEILIFYLVKLLFVVNRTDPVATFLNTTLGAGPGLLSIQRKYDKKRVTVSNLLPHKGSQLMGYFTCP